MMKLDLACFLWLPNGGVLIEQLNLANVLKMKQATSVFRTPHLAKGKYVFNTGHLPYYAESMFP